MTDDVAEELAGCLKLAEIVSRVLPIDPELDRLAEQAMQRRAARTVRRKITKRARR